MLSVFFMSCLLNCPLSCFCSCGFSLSMKGVLLMKHIFFFQKYSNQKLSKQMLRAFAQLCQVSSRIEISLQYSGGVRFRFSLIWFLLLFLSALTQFLSFSIVSSRILSMFCAYLHNTRPEGYMVTQKDPSQLVASKAVPYLMFLCVKVTACHWQLPAELSLRSAKSFVLAQKFLAWGSSL